VARILLLFGFCSLALAQAPSQAGVDWRFAQPDADIKMSLNVQALLNSPSIAKAIEQGKTQAGNNAMQIDLVLGMLRTVDRISISAHRKADAKAQFDLDVVGQVTGSFNPQLIAGFVPSTSKSKVKAVGPNTLLFGEGDSLSQAAERMTGGMPTPADQQGQNDFWISAGYGFLSQQAKGAGQPMPPLFQSLREVSLGLNLGDAPEINVLLTAADAAAAGEILKMFQGAMGPVGQLNPAAGAAAKALSMKQDGSNVRLHLVVPPEVMASAQQFAQQQAATAGVGAQLAPLLGSLGLGSFAPAGSAKPSAGATPPVPPPPARGNIVIYGLDGGPKQIPVK
jgi:hypothetical protein